MAKPPHDFLSQFRKPAPRSGGEPPQPGERKPYEAFRVTASPAALAIYPMLGPAHNPTYSYLFNVSWDDDIFETIVLFFTFMQVNIRGRNLEPVVEALRMRKCEWVRQFHEREHVPSLEGDPVIDSIEFVVKDLPTALGENARQGDLPQNV